MRLIFVADEIPTELRRVVEFLNQQMDPAEVLAVEIKQYVGGNLKTLVPCVVGQTTEAQQKKFSAVHKSRQWDEASFFQELENRAPEAVEPAKAILEWATSKMSRVVWGKGKQYGTFSPRLDHGETEHKPVQVWTDGSLPIWFGDMQTKPPFSSELKRLEFLRRLNQIPGVDFPDTAIDKYPSISLFTLNSKAAVKQFLETLDWAVEEIRSS